MHTCFEKTCRDLTLSMVWEVVFRTTPDEKNSQQLSLCNWSEIFLSEVVGKDFSNSAECKLPFLPHDGRLSQMHACTCICV